MTALDNVGPRDTSAFLVGACSVAALFSIGARPHWWVLSVVINVVAAAMNARTWAKLSRGREITIRVEEGQWKWPSNLRIPDRRRP